jgi:hypothetical protein
MGAVRRGWDTEAPGIGRRQAFWEFLEAGGSVSSLGRKGKHHHDLILRSGSKSRVSKDGPQTWCVFPSFETALRASSG